MSKKALLVGSLSSLTDIHQRSIIAPPHWKRGGNVDGTAGGRPGKARFLSPFSRSQGHSWDEGMRMKEWSLKDAISRLGG